MTSEHRTIFRKLQQMKPILRAVNNAGDLVMSGGDEQVAEHTFSSTTIFVRTAKGIEQSRNRESELPQRLKSILLLIDGRTPLSRFVQTLTVYGDVTELFQVLVDLGLIAAVASNAPRVETKPAEPVRTVTNDPTPNGPSKPDTIAFDSIRDELGFAKSSAPSALKTNETRPAASAFSKETRVDGFGNFGSAFAPVARASITSPAAQSAQLKRSLNLVNDWIPDLFGAESIEVMLELEKCSTNDELVATVSELQPMMLEKLGKPETIKRLGALKEMLKSPF
jgi:hypothetical protein